jgi:hypothetical protein
MNSLKNHPHMKMKKMNEFPWGVLIILGTGLTGTAYIIYSILKLAAEEMKDEPPSH